MNTTMSTEFLFRCFRPGETIAVLLRRENPARIVQRIVTLEQAASPAYMRWLAHENSVGLNVYVAANPLRFGSRKCTKECIAEIRRLYLDIDFDGDLRIAAMRASGAVPRPNAILSTSPGKYQVLWFVEGFDFVSQEQMLKLLVSAFGGDAACTDCNRVLRIPGFHNTKYTPPHSGTVEYLSGSPATAEDFRLSSSLPSRVVTRQASSRPSAGGKHTHSEQDWAWVLSELSGGKDATQLTQELANRRADKPNPLYYAQRTVDMAFARLALFAGTSIEDIISSLEARHSAVLSAALCSARAREIAQTAAHMIARQKRA